MSINRFLVSWRCLTTETVKLSVSFPGGVVVERILQVGGDIEVSLLVKVDIVGRILFVLVERIIRVGKAVLLRPAVGVGPGDVRRGVLVRERGTGVFGVFRVESGRTL